MQFLYSFKCYPAYSYYSEQIQSSYDAVNCCLLIAAWGFDLSI